MADGKNLGAVDLVFVPADDVAPGLLPDGDMGDDGQPV